MELAVLALVVGVVVGVVVGALGAGGGILAVPVLVFVLGMPAHQATAASLVIVLITALVSLPHHWRRGTVRAREGLVFALLAILGAVGGSLLSPLVPERILLLLFGVMLGVVAAAMLRRARRTRGEEGPEAPGAAPVHDDPVLDRRGPDEVVTEAGTRHHGRADLPPAAPAAPRPVLVAAAAIGTGFLTGFFGVGGGFVVVPVLILVLGLAMRYASGTILLVMVVVTAASLLARLGSDVQIDWTLTLVFAAGSAVGGILGGPLSARARPSTLTLLFAILLGGVAAATLAGVLLP